MKNKMKNKDSLNNSIHINTDRQSLCWASWFMIFIANLILKFQGSILEFMSFKIKYSKI